MEPKMKSTSKQSPTPFDGASSNAPVQPFPIPSSPFPNSDGLSPHAPVQLFPIHPSQFPKRHPRYDNRNALILGAGRSGLAAARLIQARGGRAAVVDAAWKAEALKAFAQEGFRCLAVDHSHLPDGDYDLVVASPSIPLTHPWIRIARDRGLALISELELGSVYWCGESVAITGSKGKSSVVKCLTDTLTRAGRRAVTAGNYGTPLSARVLECPDFGAGTLAVVEVSSFQMEHTRTFAPHLAAILNLQADHLDRHGTQEAYAALKRRLFQAQRPGDRAYLPWGLSPLGIPTGVTLERFGPEAWVDWRYVPGAVLHGGATIPVAGPFDNPVLGSAAALLCAMLTELGLPPEAISAGLAAYAPLPHRMQRLGEARGVAFIDDSKATSLAATQAALRMVGRNVRLIAGGQLKEDDLDFLDAELTAAARKAYLIGEAQAPLFNAWRDLLPCAQCGTLQTAVRAAFAEAEPGDTILLSPGCASFDQFPGMAARGDAFRALFEDLAQHA